MAGSEYLDDTKPQPDPYAGEFDAQHRERVGFAHIPVLLQSVLDGLQIKPDGRYVDATVGSGGHAVEILKASAPEGRLLGLDRDLAALEVAKERLAAFDERADLVHSSFGRLEEIVRERQFVPVDGILFDLGFSSLQLADPGRGFAFMTEGPLDMRYNPQAGGPTAADLVNGLPSRELAELLRRYGEEKYARRIADAIVEARPLNTTTELARLVERTVRRRGRIHPATRTFQALRIAVNDELAIVEIALPQAVEILAPGGRLVVISFHSLEDRIVKRFFRRASRDCVCPSDIPVCVCDHQATLRTVFRKPIRPTEDEVMANPRARSARLRIAERVG
jgi:16S rRNA (cytosine1402-N4)-methyltransferase